MFPNPSLSKKEQQALNFQRVLRRKRFLKIIFWLIAGGGAALAVFGLMAWNFSAPAESIISRSGIHWHPELSILINGKKQVIPADIGIGAVHQSIHTHDATGIIHLEFGGLVRKQDSKLDRFFKIWRMKFNKDCIFDYCNGPEGKVKFFVNGKENAQFEQYEMQDGDKIEIRYE